MAAPVVQASQFSLPYVTWVWFVGGVVTVVSIATCTIVLSCLGD